MTERPDPARSDDELWPAKPLIGRRALVTGGGSGIGLGIARRLAQAGAIVTIAGRSKEKLTGGADQIRGETPAAEVRTVECDVTRSADVAAAVDLASSGGGGLDIAVANAGSMGSAIGPFLCLDEKAWRDICEINIVGSANTIRLAAEAMRERGGSIIATSSAISHGPQIGNSHYVATKAALNMMILGAAAELGRLNIRVNGLLPGVTPTGLSSVAAPPDIMPQHIARTAIKRVATVEEQGDLVVFLASDRARFITGQLIAVDGGLSAQPLSDLSSLTRAILGAEINDRALGL